MKRGSDFTLKIPVTYILDIGDMKTDKANENHWKNYCKSLKWKSQLLFSPCPLISEKIKKENMSANQRVRLFLVRCVRTRPRFCRWKFCSLIIVLSFLVCPLIRTSTIQFSAFSLILTCFHYFHKRFGFKISNPFT